MSDTIIPLTDSQLGSMLQKVKGQSFAEQIANMNRMYKLPVNTEPTLNVGEFPHERLTKFLKTLADEIAEGEEIRDFLKQHQDNLTEENFVKALTMLADWFGDITVYCRSEAMKFGIPHEDVLDAIQASNATKLPDDGVPIYDENGKFLKDKKNFVPPEPAIAAILFGTKGE